MKQSALTVIAACLLATACGGGGGGGSSNGGGSSSSSSSSGGGSDIQDIELEPTFSSIQGDLFTPVCTECHTGSSPPQGLNLEADQSYGLLVDVPSNQMPSVDRVEPGEPDNSYLIQKLEGTASSGARMPANGPPYLTGDQIAVIRQWISDGATDDRTMAAPASVTGPARVTAVNPQPDAELDEPPAYVTIAVNRPLDATLVNRQTVKVIAGDEQPVGPVSVSVSENNRGLIIVDLREAGLNEGRYRVVITDNNGISVATVDGIPVDGDGDGTPGGAFESAFTVSGGDS